MYLSHYHLNEKPFQISTDPKFLWMGEKHKEALAVLKYGILDNRGFLLLTGDVGTGKTTLINALINSLGDQIIVATVYDPGLEKLDFFKIIADAFNIPKDYRSKGAFLIDFREFLLKAYQKNKQVLLIIDESQRLNPDLLEEIRLLSNIEKENIKLLNIFFVGQIEFNDYLLDPLNRALRQRITINFNIDPLSEAETNEYIAHRLKIAGSKRNPFNAKAIREVYRYSEGYPRLINVICDHALLTGYVEEQDIITPAIVKECSRELTIVSKTNVPFKISTEEHAEAPPRLEPAEKEKGPRKLFLYGVIVALLSFIVGYLYSPISSNFLATSDYFMPRNGDLNTANQYTPPFAPKAPSRASSSANAAISMHKSSANTDASTPIKQGPTFNELQKRNIADAVRPAETPSSTHESTVAATTVESAEKSRTEQLKAQFEAIANRKHVVYYDYNSNDLPDDAIQMLDRLSAVLVQNPGAKIIVQGYTDNTGGYLYNKKLSEFRANIVKSYFIGKGVNPSDIEALGLGPDTSALTAHTPPLKTRRRVEIEITR